jgi:signal transduction protein with GAF and PtsI domain
MERFNLKKLKEADGKEQNRVEITSRFAAFEKLDAGVHINRACETIRDNIKISAKKRLGYYELKKQTPWLHEWYSELLYRRKQKTLQWAQDPGKINEDNLNNIRREASKHFRNNKSEYLKDKINDLATDSKGKNTRYFIEK